ncbi:IS30 family transposase [Oscillibacter sp.]|uniref:IS30 family transposase n=1 Tax=Oscillibacter sp. TaxID=1945593 RepID=UPI002580743A|nr:IS30 family transposase [Oscillibacter sp.]
MSDKTTAAIAAEQQAEAPKAPAEALPAVTLDELEQVDLGTVERGERAPFRITDDRCADWAIRMLTERKTRREIIVPMRDKTSESVVRALNGIERKLGALFPRIFVTITCDNGTEFADAEGIESKRRGKGKRTTVYYCHPYTPSERGTNENQNGLIRRLVPKGTDLATISPQEVKAAEAWLNSYPRKMFGFLCSEQLFREELALILAR